MVSSTPVPPHYPVFTGDYYTGQSCKSLLISGAAQMEINGNFTIYPQSRLKFTDNGNLRISGDWTNFGTFEAGNGCIEFIGSSDSHISQEVLPNDISAYTLYTLPVGMTELSGTSNVLSGDNAHLDISIGFSFNYLGVEYDQLRINTNGWVSLNKSGSDATSMNNINLFTNDQPTTVLAPWWDNLKADASSRISYQATDNKITIEWNNVLAYNSASTTRLSFQLILYGYSNMIDFCYGTVTQGTHNASESASIGIKDAQGGMGHFIEATSGSKYNISTCLESATGWPVFNYRFSKNQGDIIEEVFHKIEVSKSGGRLELSKDVRITGIEQ
jgi:hypothetical protein